MGFRIIAAFVLVFIAVALPGCSGDDDNSSDLSRELTREESEVADVVLKQVAAYKQADPVKVCSRFSRHEKKRLLREADLRCVDMVGVDFSLNSADSEDFDTQVKDLSIVVQGKSAVVRFNEGEPLGDDIVFLRKRGVWQFTSEEDANIFGMYTR